ncbi:hypothetical protein RHMOL_Rhmol05G0139700 [Rhododendron molle]|uniref:Uncharacterized protein n=1 Tax=Rhododendron molle TaxID=49168 RepID=A0ACC0NQX0_RHOML|nr:hypothetical protein RHMOL_Rhmol05G0139700 [Rhododendron molle]
MKSKTHCTQPSMADDSNGGGGRDVVGRPWDKVAVHGTREKGWKSKQRCNSWHGLLRALVQRLQRATATGLTRG